MKKVLLIEDDLDLYQLLKYNLERSGFQFTGANTGKGAVEFCLQERPDLILLDIMLRDSTGLEISARLRSLPANSRRKNTPRRKANHFDTGTPRFLAAPVGGR